MIQKGNIKFYPFDTAMFLDNDEIIVSYLQDAMQEGDKEFMKALETVARAKGMTELAKRTGLSRESLYKTLNGETKPRFESIQKILAALNIKLSLVAAG
ncbi:MAG: putative addiction module antidote protein [Mailhella sp.]|nr:putative addiction module antidote protein [Mailhella sp.]